MTLLLVEQTGTSKMAFLFFGNQRRIHIYFLGSSLSSLVNPFARIALGEAESTTHSLIQKKLNHPIRSHRLVRSLYIFATFWDWVVTALLRKSL